MPFGSLCHGSRLMLSMPIPMPDFAACPSGFREIPGAVAEVISGGISASPVDGLDLTARLRHFGKAPLIEDGSVTSDPTTLVNLGAFYDFGRLRLGAELFNVFDANDADITYFYESQPRW